MRKVLVEGPPDLTLVRALGFTRKTSSKRDGKGGVCNYLEKNTNLLGLVDEDPRSEISGYLKSLKVEQLNHNLLLYSDLKNKNKIIALRPRLEEWIIKICKDAGISLPKQFNLPDTPKALHESVPQKLVELENLVMHLLKVKNPAILFLQEHLITPE